MTTKDFSEWLICMDLSDYEDIYSLYRSVEECETYGSFETQIAKGSNNGWIVKATYIDELLHLASEKAKNTFLSMIEKGILMVLMPKDGMHTKKQWKRMIN